MVISAQASRLADVLAVAQENGADLCILDTAPHSESVALAAARAADLILIPCRPAILDIRAIQSSAELAAIAKKPAIAVLNSVPHRGGLADQAAAAIRGYNLDVAPTRLTQRAAFVHSLTAAQGVTEYEPGGAAAEEILNLCKLACNHAGMITGKLKSVNSEPERATA